MRLGTSARRPRCAASSASRPPPVLAEVRAEGMFAIDRSGQLSMPRPSNQATNLQHDETVVLFPSLGHLSPDGETWHVQVHGEVFSQRTQVGIAKRFLLRMLKRAMQAPDAEM